MKRVCFRTMMASLPLESDMRMLRRGTNHITAQKTTHPTAFVYCDALFPGAQSA